jgi:hypothetical protein
VSRRSERKKKIEAAPVEELSSKELVTKAADLVTQASGVLERLDKLLTTGAVKMEDVTPDVK